MKPRILKKLSKKLATISKNLPENKNFGEVWIDSEFEIALHMCDYFCSGSKDYKIAPAWKKRKYWQTRVNVNNVPCIGGGVDYWGEGQDWSPVFGVAQEVLLWSFGEPTEYEMKDDEGNVICEQPGWPKLNIKLNGKNVMKLARQYAEKFHQ